MEEEEDIPLNFYLVQSPSSVSSSIHHNHHHHLKLTPKPLPIINPLDHDDDDDDDDDENVADMKTTNTTTLDISRCCSSRASLTCISLDNFDDHKHSLVTNHNKLDVIPLLPPHSHPIPNNHNNEAYSSSQKSGKYPYHYYNNKHDEDDDDDDDDEKGCCKYLSMKTYPASSLWICIQVMWRLLFSFLVALLVFYLATNPPPPHLSLQVGEVKEFELAEGVDRSGVETNLLTCNISMLVVIDNNSKLFSLQLYPLRTALYYGRIPLVLSHKQLLEEDVKKVKNEEKKEIKVSVGVRGMAMYGAGRDMQDALHIKTKGHLELVTTVWVHSYYKIIPKLIHPNFHHKAYCVFSIYNFPTQVFNTTCRYFLS